MSIRPTYRKRSVLQVLSDGMNAQPPARFTRDDLPSEEDIQALAGKRVSHGESTWGLVLDAVVAHLNERSGVPAGAGKSCCEDAALNAADVDRLTRERDELQAKLEAAGQRPTLNREAVRKVAMNWLNDTSTAADIDEDADAITDAIIALVPAVPSWPEWLGPRVDPDDFEVTRGEDGYVYVDGFNAAGPSVTDKSIREIPYGSDVANRAKREAVARFIESEQSVTVDEGQRVEEQAKALCEALHPGSVPWECLSPYFQNAYRSAIRAGWTPPESECEK